MYLSIFTGYTCFTFLGFAAIGAAIGIVATVVVAVGSEVAFVLARKDEAEKLRQERYLVWEIVKSKEIALKDIRRSTARNLTTPFSIIWHHP
jgi:hypothetical protein